MLEPRSGVAALWMVFALATVAGCGGDSSSDGSGANNGGESVSDPAFPSAAWTRREAENFARVLDAPTEQVSNPAFLQRLTARSVANLGEYTQRSLRDPSWLLANIGDDALTEANLLDALDGLISTIQNDPSAALSLSFNSPVTPLCATYAGPCAGDPFYSDVGRVEPIVFYDRDCTRLSGRVWAPDAGRVASPRPAIVIQTGSIQAPQPVHWWAAEALVESGYVVLTFDVRGQGRSDFTSPSGQPGTDVDPTVFFREMVDAIDFIQSSANRLYPHNRTCRGHYPTAVTDYNPFAGSTDGDRIGLAGHSTGGYSVAVVQSYGEGGTRPWPGELSDRNPVKAVVAWDGMVDPQGEFGAYGQLEHLDVPLYQDLFQVLTGHLAGGPPRVKPRVPAMMQFSDYGAAPVPYVEPPPEQAYKRGYRAWRAEGLPAFAFTIRGSSHYEWSLLPLFPATSWCPRIESGQCEGGWGLPMAECYTVAWFDRWLKKPGEPGYEDADARLLDDDKFAGRFSYHFESARAFKDRQGYLHRCESIRGGCSD